MRLLQYTPDGDRRKVKLGGVVEDDANAGRIKVVPLDHVAPDLKTLLEGGQVLMLKADEEIQKRSAIVDVPVGQLLPPVHNPDKVLCVGLNYVDHCKEANQPVPEVPVIFNKFSTSLCASGDPIRLPPPSITSQVDYEVELAVIVSKRLSHSDQAEFAANPLDFIGGYCIANDISSRDIQFSPQSGGQWVLGKSFDTFCPLGPYMVTPDAVPKVEDSRLWCTLNGKIMQDSSTSDMCHDVATIMSFVSQRITLLPGDIILTGTPFGVGFTRDPPISLKHGDEVVCGIEGLGSITNRVQGQSE